MPEPEMIPLADAACQLRLSWHAAWRRVLVGDLTGERRGRQWFVTAASVRNLKRSTELPKTTPVPIAGRRA